MELPNIWSNGYDWDDQLSVDDNKRVTDICSNLEKLQDIKQDRMVSIDGKDWDLVINCDASKNAFGAVAYVVSETKRNLLMSRVKLARKTSIPELELDAIHMAAELAKTLTNIIEFKNVMIVSESLINLNRLKKHPNNMESGLALRIMKIRKLGGYSYQHTTTDKNAANLLSRGCSVKELAENNNWWICFELDNISRFQDIIDPIWIAMLIEEPKCICLGNTSYDRTMIKYQFISKAIRRMGTKIVKYQSSTDLILANILLIRKSQNRHFKEELKSMLHNESMPKNSSLYKYNCFIDENGLLRIKTRLQNCKILTSDERNSIVLTSKCLFVQALVERIHNTNFHAGVARIMEKVREKFWVVNLKKLLKVTQKRCNFCIRKLAQVESPSFGQVPEYRVDSNISPFTHIGIDILGPLKIPQLKPSKRYGLIFSCATTRAIHLELLKDISSETTLLAMRRFFARYGVPHTIYSDNGTRFVKIRKHLLEFMDDLKRINHDQPFKWIRQAVAAPWRGGFYERMNRTIKNSLASITFRKKNVTDEELITILIEIEGHINDRPLFQMEGEIITPSCFIHPKRLSQLPPLGNIKSKSIYRDERLVDNLIKSRKYSTGLWNTWKNMYLKELKLFHKNRQDKVSCFEVGNIVIVKNHKGMDDWPVGIITQVHKSPHDDIIRSISVKIKNEENIRVIQSVISIECIKGV